MKYLKILSLSAIAAAAVMAFVGAGTASATTVCTLGTTTAPCGSGETPYSGKIVAHLVPGTTAVLSGTLKVECTSSTVEGETNSAGEGSITNATWSNCTNCPEIKALNLPWKAHATTGTAPNGTMTVENPSVLLGKCLGGVANCVASASSVVLDVDGGEPALVLAKSEPLNMSTESGFGCGTSGTWTASYEALTPSTGLFLR